MSTLVNGYTFAATERVTAAKLNALVSNGSVSGIVQADATDTLIVTGTSAPPVATGRAWFDTTQGAGRGLFKLYDNGRWTAVAQGFLAYNNGTTLARGNLVYYDSSLTPATVGTVPVAKTQIPTSGAVQMARPIGVAAETIANANTGIIIESGYATCLKDAATVTAGDALVASLSVLSEGKGTTGNLGSWGTPGGSASIGKWLDTNSSSAGTEVSVYLYGPSAASWVAFKNSGGSAVYSGVTVSVFTAWTGSATFSTAPIGTIARICQVTLTKSATNGQMVVGLRMTNATVDIGTGAPFFAGFMTAGATANHTIRAQLIVPETTAASGNALQYYVSGTDTSGTITLTVYETGVIVGGQIA